jgi:hypothetical protein
MNQLEPTLDEAKRGDVCALLAFGCSRDTAAGYVGSTVDAVEALAARDADFAAQIVLAEAQAELTHVRNVHSAGGDVKNWRASVWMLERRFPERFGKREPEVVTKPQMQQMMKRLSHVLLEVVPDEAQRAKILESIQQISKKPSEEESRSSLNS